jgi:hypothetical protein
VQFVVIIVCEMWICNVSNNISVNHLVSRCQKVLLCVFVGARSLRAFDLHRSRRIPSGAHLCAALLALWLAIHLLPFRDLYEHHLIGYLPSGP